MADVKQIYAVLNDAVEQALGKDAVATIDATNVSTLGDTIAATGNMDVLGMHLLDRVGKVVLEDRSYKSAWRFLAKNEMEWGAIVEKVHTRLMTAQSNSSYGWQGGTAPDPFAINMPQTDVKLFKNLTAWEIPVTIPDEQLKTAFKSATEMESFISSLFTTFENSIEYYFECEAITVFATRIAVNKQASDAGTAGVHYVKLLTEYNTLNGTALTAGKALYDKEFLQYAVSRITDIKGLMSTFSTTFNIDAYERFTPDANLKAVALNLFASTCKTHMESEIYHNDLVSLSGYNEVPYWQGIGDSTFSDRAQLSQFVPGQNPTTDTAITAENVVFVLVDDRGVGAMLRNQHTTSQRNNRGEYTNYWAKGEQGNFIDTSEQCVVFALV